MLKKLACLVLTVTLVLCTSVATAHATPATMTVWGTVKADGSIVSSSGGFTVKHIVTKSDSGEYKITFAPEFTCLPAIVGSQVNWPKDNENTLDNVVFREVGKGSAIAITGSSTGQHTDRSFAFIAIGCASESDCE